MYAIVFHAHQKLDRVARRHLRELLPHSFFPSARQIVQFEGEQGPDGAKLKRSQADEQPWHFIDPHDTSDTELHRQIQHHYAELVMALQQRDDIRSAWEAAWLAHALVDGLTPAHHYPYESELAELRGEARHSRKGLIGRLYVQGDTAWQSLGRSLKLVGPKGLLTTHAMFEAGAYTIIAPLKLNKARPSPADLKRVESEGVVAVFRRMVKEVAGHHIYARFYARGWSQAISRDIRRQLAPRMVKMITLAWYAASREAEAVQTRAKS